MKAMLSIVALFPLWLSQPATSPSKSGDATPATQPSGGAPATQPAHQPSIATESVHRGTLTTSVEAQGWFEPVDGLEVRIRPKVYQGELAITNIVSNGASVKKGDVILQLDPATINKQLAAALNEQTASHAGLTKAEADAKIGEESDALNMKMQLAATKEAEEQVKWFETVDGPQMLKNVELGLKSQKSYVEDQEDELDELKKMYKTDDLSTATADIVVKRAVRNLDLSKQALKMMEERAEKVKTFTYPAAKQRVLDGATAAKQSLEALQAAQIHSKVLRETGLASARAGVAAVDQKVDDIKADLEKLTVRAPADGIVNYGQLSGGGWVNGDGKNLKVGERIAPQAVVMTFWTPGKLHVATTIPEQKFVLIHAGQKASVTPVAFSDSKLEGTCDAVPAEPMSMPQGAVYALTISLPQADSKFVPGMRTNVKIDATEADNVVLVPNSALANNCVWVKTHDGQKEKRTVTTGKSDGKRTEIKSGLSEGDEIFTEAQHG